MVLTLRVVFCFFLFAASFLARAADNAALPSNLPSNEASCRTVINGNEARRVQQLLDLFPIPLSESLSIEKAALRHGFLARVRTAEVSTEQLSRILNSRRTSRSIKDTLAQMNDESLFSDARPTLDMGSSTAMERFLKNGILWEGTEVPTESSEDFYALKKQAHQLAGDLAVLSRGLDLMARDEVKLSEIEQRKLFGKMIELASELLTLNGIPHKVTLRPMTKLELREDIFRIEFEDLFEVYDPVETFRELRKIEESRELILLDIAAELGRSPSFREKETVRNVIEKARKRAIRKFAEDSKMIRQDFYREPNNQTYRDLLAIENELAVLLDTQISVLAVAQPVERTIDGVKVPAGHHWIRFEHPERGSRQAREFEYFINAENPKQIHPI